METGRQLGEYIIEAEIGGGGMAKVYRARHAVLDTVHALKVLDDKYRANPEARRRFLDEAKIQAKHLQHAGIVKVTNIVSTADAAALVMDLVDGGSLEGYITDRKRPFTASELLAMSTPILDAMAHAHDAGIIHRDLKPANVLLKKQGDRLIPIVTDFGIAKVIDGEASAKKKSTHADARMGTLGYMSPEQIRKAKDVTARSDIFSLGAMFYEMVTGRVPFDGDSDFDIMEKIVHGRFEPPEKNADPNLPPHVFAAIKRAMESDPAKRFATCREFSTALTEGKFAAASSAGLRPLPVGGGGPRWKMFAGLAAVAVLAGGAAVYFAMRGPPAAATAPVDAALVATVPATVAPVAVEQPIAVPIDAAAIPIDAPPDPDAAPLDVAAPPVDALKTGRGVSYVVLRPGRGASPGARDEVTVTYKGWTTDGTLFEKVDKPQTFALRSVIVGWSETLPQMQAGGSYRIWVPEALAFKGHARAPKGTLVFDMELLAVKKAAPPPSCAGKWSGEVFLSISGGGRTCGTISIPSGPGRCTGALTGCSDGARFAAKYACRLNNTDYSGTIAMGCTSSSTTASVKINGYAKSKSVRRN